MFLPRPFRIFSDRQRSKGHASSICFQRPMYTLCGQRVHSISKNLVAAQGGILKNFLPPFSAPFSGLSPTGDSPLFFNPTGDSNCKFQMKFSGFVLGCGILSLARQRMEKTGRRMRGCGGEGGREEKPSPQHHVYAAFLLRPTLAFRFVDSGSGWGEKSGSLAILFNSDSSLRMVGTIAHLCGWPSARFLW